MMKLIKICFWLAVVVMFLPEDATTSLNSQKFSTAEAVELASAGIKDVGGFCTRNPDACMQGQQAITSISQKTINTARSIYDYLQENPTDDVQNGLEQVLSPKDLLSIEDQIKLAQKTGQTLSVSDLNIDFSTANAQ